MYRIHPHYYVTLFLYPIDPTGIPPFQNTDKVGTYRHYLSIYITDQSDSM